MLQCFRVIYNLYFEGDARERESHPKDVSAIDISILNLDLNALGEIYYFAICV